MDCHIEAPNRHTRSSGKRHKEMMIKIKYFVPCVDWFIENGCGAFDFCDSACLTVHQCRSPTDYQPHYLPPDCKPTGAGMLLGTLRRPCLSTIRVTSLHVLVRHCHCPTTGRPPVGHPFTHTTEAALTTHLSPSLTMLPLASYRCHYHSPPHRQ